MRPLTSPAAELLDRLGSLLRPAPTLADRLVRGWHRLRPGAQAARWNSSTGTETLTITLAGLLDALVRTREPRAVLALIGPALRASGEEQRPVREALRRLLHQLTCADLLQLDAAVRSSAPADVLQALAGGPEALAREPAGQVFVELCTLVRDGRTREAALTALGTGAAGGGLGLLLIRINDWVEPVRVAALRSLEPCLTAERRAELVAALPLLLRLQRARRADHRALVERALQLLAPSQGATSALLAGLGSFDPEVVRASARLLFGAAGHLDLRRVAGLLGDHRNHLRLGAARQLVRLATDAAAAGQRSELEALLQQTWRDGLAQVRCAALRAHLATPREGADPLASPLLEEALVDPALPVRQLARAERHRLGIAPPPREAYLVRLGPEPGVVPATASGRRTLVGTLLGLGETGKPVDRVTVAAWLSVDSTRVRRAALRSMGFLDNRGLRPELLAALSDPHRSVADEAARGLSHGLGPAEQAALLSLAVDPATPAHGVMLALGLLAEIAGWTALPAVVLAAGDPRPEVAARAQLLLRRLCHGPGRTKRGVKEGPTAAQLAAVRAAMALVREPEGARLLEVELASLESTLSYWGGKLGGEGRPATETQPSTLSEPSGDGSA